MWKLGQVGSAEPTSAFTQPRGAGLFLGPRARTTPLSAMLHQLSGGRIPMEQGGISAFAPPTNCRRRCDG